MAMPLWKPEDIAKQIKLTPSSLISAHVEYNGKIYLVVAYLSNTKRNQRVPIVYVKPNDPEAKDYIKQLITISLNAN